MGKYRDKILEQLDQTKQQTDKLVKWVEYDRVDKEQNVKILNDILLKLENVENLIEIDK